MALIDDIMAAVSPVISEQTANFGASLSVVRGTKNHNTEARNKFTYTADVALTAVRGFLLSPESARKRNIFGVTATCKMVCAIPGVQDLEPGDGVRILSGPYFGQDFVCEAKGAADSVGAFTNVSLIEDRAGDIAASLP